MVRMASFCKLVRLRCAAFQLHAGIADFVSLISDAGSKFRKPGGSFLDLAFGNFAMFAFLVPSTTFRVLP